MAVGALQADVEVELPGDLVEVRNTEPIGDLTVTASSTFVLYALAGGVAGYAAVKLREAEREISMVQAREEFLLDALDANEREGLVRALDKLREWAELLGRQG